MLVEFCGSTGSGKSTLATETVQQITQLGVQATLADDIVLETLRLDQLAGGFVRRTAVNILAALEFLRSMKSYRAVAVFSAKVLWQEADSFWLWLHLYRNVIKRLGVYAVASRRTIKERIIIIDEGTLHIVHNLFVHMNSDPDLEKVLEFANLVPLPDLVIFVQTPVELCVERTLQRGHRRIETNSRANVESFIRKAHRVFTYLVSVERVAKRLVTVDNSDRTGCITSIAYDTAVSILKQLSFTPLETSSS